MRGTVRRAEAVVAVHGRGGRRGAGGVTALLCVEALELSGGERVLIVGATGGVGAFAVQLCAAAGATVIAPGHEHDRAYLEGLGAAEVPERGTLPSTSTR